MTKTMVKQDRHNHTMHFIPTMTFPMNNMFSSSVNIYPQLSARGENKYYEQIVQATSSAANAEVTVQS